jgi:hypothetical protein
MKDYAEDTHSDECSESHITQGIRLVNPMEQTHPQQFFVQYHSVKSIGRPRDIPFFPNAPGFEMTLSLAYLMTAETDTKMQTHIECFCDFHKVHNESKLFRTMYGSINPEGKK